MVHRLSLALLLLLGCLLLGCLPRVQLAPEGGHGNDVAREVPYPPPPARVEILPAPPHDDAVWVDGTWAWNGRDYQWQTGGWRLPSEDAYYAPAKLLRRRNGMLLYLKGQWHEPR